MSPATRVFAILCAIVFALSASTSAAITHTSVVLFSPWSSSGLRNDFIVSEKVKGSCWTHSLASERPDAWRCMADHDIYDPCFSGSPRKGTVACAEGPFSSRITLLTVAKPLSDTMKLTGDLWGLRLRGAPWGLRLVSGDTCIFAQGATDAIGGERLNYACAKMGWIIGVPDRSTTIWTVRSVNSPNKHVTQVGIMTAVF
jgi:hypothetical protein